MRRLAIGVLVSFLLVRSLSALSLEASLPEADPAEVEALLGGATVMAYVDKPGALRLAPLGPEGAYVRLASTARPARFFVECAFLVRGASLSNEGRSRVFNELTAVNSLSSVTYHSELRDRATPLFSDPRIVTGPGSRESMPLPASLEAPKSAGFDFYFRDANFGPSWFRVEIDGSGPGFTVALTNSKALGIAFIQAFSVGGLRMRFALVPVDEGLLVYGTCAAEPSPAASALVDMWSAMEKRLNAIRGWIVGKIG